MTRLTQREHDHVLQMIERMQRDGHPEHAIHDAVRRATRGEQRPERRHDGGRSLFRLFRLRERRA